MTAMMQRKYKPFRNMIYSGSESTFEVLVHRDALPCHIERIFEQMLWVFRSQ